MLFASSVSTLPDLRDAVSEAAESVRDRLGGTPDLVIAFTTPHHQDLYERLPGLVARELGGPPVIGGSGGGVLAGGHEVERTPGLALLAGRLPDVRVLPFYLPWSTIPDADEPEAWYERLDIGPHEVPQLVLLPDPYTSDALGLVEGLDRAWPGAPKIGGLISGGQQPGHNALFGGGELHRHGLAGVALLGDVRMDTVVAQGCRPVGPPLFATRTTGNVIHELDGRPPSETIEEVWRSLGPVDRALLRTSVTLGITMRDQQEQYGRGDFLIRNILGLDQETGALVVGATVQRNQVVQLHVRDASTSAADLDALLASSTAEDDSEVAAALVFACLGRGERLYGVPDHDSSAVIRHLGDVPMAGFFCNGEIGPVQHRTYLHGYTSSIGILRRRSLPEAPAAL